MLETPFLSIYHFDDDFRLPVNVYTVYLQYSDISGVVVVVQGILIIFRIHTSGKIVPKANRDRDWVMV